ncbi:MAG TPA: hypothetical protein VF982_01880 [Anaerolineales bacterium]
MSIMDQIANPQMADIAGALDYRQRRLDAEDQKRKDIRLGQLVAEAVPNLKPGSVLHELALESPKEFALFAKAAGVPLNSGEQMQQLADDTALLYTTAQSDPYSAIETAQQLKADRNAAGQETPQIDRWLETVEQDPAMGFTALFTMHRSINRGGSQEPAGVREFESMTKGLSEEEVEMARRVNLGLAPRAGSSATERIADDPELGRRVADLERQTSAAGEEGKLGAQLALKPKIQEAVKAAEIKARERGEILSEYDRAQASMPGLVEVVNKLKTLSDVATYTKSGQAFDVLSKELGFGATVGATARAKMESMVNNQILPLLRDTFGAQFTEKEGESLRKTMLDINAAPEQKKEILNSFIEQKMRDLEMKRGRAKGADGDQRSGESEPPKSNQDRIQKLREELGV